jgi:hypothetical protein
MMNAGGHVRQKRTVEQIVRVRDVQLPSKLAT